MPTPPKKQRLPKRVIISLTAQRVVVFFFLFVTYALVGWMMQYLMRYRIKQIKEVRKQFKSIVQQVKGPLIICPNHLTLIDSLLILRALGSPWHYLLHFYSFAWNFPRMENVKSNLLFRVTCYLGKCVLIKREGSVEEAHQALQKARYLLKRGEYLMIFPEASRSISGRLNMDNFAYGVGQLLTKVPEAKVLCIYFRGKKQKIKSRFPAKDDQFTVNLKLINPQTEHRGLRATRDLSTQIMNTLAQMEQEYFDQRD